MHTSFGAKETYCSPQDAQSRDPSPIGALAILKTKAEVETHFQPLKAFIASVPTSRASLTVRAVDDALRTAQSATTHSIQHLRRFVKSEHLPENLQSQPIDFLPGAFPGTLARQVEDGNCKDRCEFTSSSSTRLHLLICATADLSIDRIRSLLTPDGLPLWEEGETRFLSITVPGQPPTSEIQARQWSQQYWPTVYKKHNPFGAHPSIISRATKEMKDNVKEFMDFARTAGQEVSAACVGESIGAVVVERSAAGHPAVVMVAGDARWNLTGKAPEFRRGNGNVMAHAVMRAIALVAAKRRDISSKSPNTSQNKVEEAFADTPLTQLEAQVYSASQLKPDGYLCLDLEFHLTHEPCVMCSMALLHSRVGRVVFEKQMVATGGLTAAVDDKQLAIPSGLGYGLFWRSSLNWKFLTWQWTRTASSPSQSLETLHA